MSPARGSFDGGSEHSGRGGRGFSYPVLPDQGYRDATFRERYSGRQADQACADDYNVSAQLVRASRFLS
jgi:hypothetical protein